MPIENAPKELVWLPASLAKRLGDVTDVNAINKEILAYVEDTKADLRLSIESIDEDVLLYRAHMVKARDAFKKAKNEELEAMSDLWESYELELGKVKDKVSSLTEILKPLKDQISGLNTLCNSIPTYHIEKIADILQKINDLSPNAKDILLKAMNPKNP